MIAGHLGEVLAVIATSDPQTHANTIKYTDVVDMADWDQVIAIACTGDMASETIDFAAYKCDSDGSNPASMKAATQLAASASANDNSQVVIVLRPADMNGVSEASRYVKFGLVTGGATGGPASVVVLGIPRQGIASAVDLSTVKEIKY